VASTLKVLTYITQRDRLLVFRQPDFPEQGVQVPGGSVEPGEALATAALREAREETGLEALAIERLLGSADYELKVDVGPPHRRHFFHLSCADETPARWERIGSFPLGRVPVRFELWWEPLASARLHWEMDAYLATLPGTTHR
jgi:8-oxo-dGTP diphosphatase